MEVPVSKKYTPHRIRGKVAYRFPSEWMAGSCSVTVNGKKATVESGGPHVLVPEAGRAACLFQRCAGVPPEYAVSGGFIQHRIELVWGWEE